MARLTLIGICIGIGSGVVIGIAVPVTSWLVIVTDHLVRSAVGIAIILIVAGLVSAKFR